MEDEWNFVKIGGALCALFALGVLLLFLFACERVDVGNVGIKINMLGDVRGVAHAPTVSGWVWYNPFAQRVIEFPTVVQTVVWDEPAKDSSKPNESINFGSTEGLNINADVSISFRVDPTKAPQLYAKYRQTELDVFAHGFLRNQVKDAINEVASRMPVTKIYGEGKSELLRGAHEFLQKRFAPDGIIIDQLTFNSHLRLPPNVQNSINQSIAQTQEAERARYRVAQIEAEARQNVAKAHGDAQAVRERADANAAATLMQAEAQAKATQLQAEATAAGNRMIRESLTREVIDYEKVRRWDGKLPMIGEGAQTLLDLRAIGAGK